MSILTIDALTVVVSALLVAALIAPGILATADFWPYVAAYTSAICAGLAWLRLYPV
jgi:hypothetical protein